MVWVSYEIQDDVERFISLYIEFLVLFRMIWNKKKYIKWVMCAFICNLLLLFFFCNKIETKSERDSAFFLTVACNDYNNMALEISFICEIGVHWKIKNIEWSFPQFNWKPSRFFVGEIFSRLMKFGNWVNGSVFYTMFYWLKYFMRLGQHILNCFNIFDIAGTKEWIYKSVCYRILGIF